MDMSELLGSLSNSPFALDASVFDQISRDALEKKIMKFDTNIRQLDTLESDCAKEFLSANPRNGEGIKA